MTDKLNSKIEAVQQELAKLLREKAALDSLTPIQQLAIQLHEDHCHFNHGDQCDWHYHYKDGVPTWCGYAQAEYIKKAGMLTSFCLRHSISTDAMVAFLRGIK